MSLVLCYIVTSQYASFEKWVRSGADGSFRRAGVAHGIADKAHASQHEKRADWTLTEIERNEGNECAAHEAEFDEWVGNVVEMFSDSILARIRLAVDMTVSVTVTGSCRSIWTACGR
jgi:hypothetical protein